MISAMDEAFMVEVGVHGNIFSRFWKEIQVLATQHTWHYNLWKLYDRLKVELKIEDMYHINPAR